MITYILPIDLLDIKKQNHLEIPYGSRDVRTTYNVRKTCAKQSLNYRDYF